VKPAPLGMTHAPLLAHRCDGLGFGPHFVYNLCTGVPGGRIELIAATQRGCESRLQ